MKVAARGGRWRWQRRSRQCRGGGRRCREEEGVGRGGGGPRWRPRQHRGRRAASREEYGGNRRRRRREGGGAVETKAASREEEDEGGTGGWRHRRVGGGWWARVRVGAKAGRYGVLLSGELITPNSMGKLGTSSHRSREKLSLSGFRLPHVENSFWLYQKWLKKAACLGWLRSRPN